VEIEQSGSQPMTYQSTLDLTVTTCECQFTAVKRESGK